MSDQEGRRKPSEGLGKTSQTKSKKNRGKSPTKGASEAAEVRKQKAYELRCKGLTYQQIGDALGVSIKTAHEYVDEVWKYNRERTADSADKLREMELAKLDELEARWMPLALAAELDVSKEVIKGDDNVVHIELDAWDAGMKAVDRVLKIQERRAKLLGIEAPQKVEHSGHLTLDEYERRLKEAGA